jgi:hypothetical protein
MLRNPYNTRAYANLPKPVGASAPTLGGNSPIGANKPLGDRRFFQARRELAYPRLLALEDFLHPRRRLT